MPNAVGSNGSYTERDYENSVEREEALRESAQAHQEKSAEAAGDYFVHAANFDFGSAIESGIEANREDFEALRYEWAADREMNAREEKSE